MFVACFLFAFIKRTIFPLLLVLFSAYFIRPFYKMMLGKPLALNDMESVVSLSSCSYLELDAAMCVSSL